MDKKLDTHPALLPCPFCAATTAYVMRNENGTGLVKCGDCTAEVYSVLPDGAVENWNTRAHLAPAPSVPPIQPIEHDKQICREYIPMAGGYEFQTKGTGSTARLLCPDGNRVPFSDPDHVLKALEDMVRAQHAALTAPAQPDTLIREAAMIELAAEALWRRDYPNGGSMFKTYESLNLEDKILYRNAALAAAPGKRDGG